VLVLDEPSNGLDASAVATLVRQIDAQRERGAVLLTTHDMDLASKVGAKVVRLEDGAIR
jgi:peptide/nickel transport system ATP-binding protein